MYRKAVTNKTAGGVLALALIGVFIGATVFLSQLEKTTLVITGICVIFLICIAFSMFGYMRLTEMQAQFSDDLETSVDRCTEQAAGKYFFFPIVWWIWRMPASIIIRISRMSAGCWYRIRIIAEIRTVSRVQASLSG